MTKRSGLLMYLCTYLTQAMYASDCGNSAQSTTTRHVSTSDNARGGVRQGSTGHSRSTRTSVCKPRDHRIESTLDEGRDDHQELAAAPSASVNAASAKEVRETMEDHGQAACKRAASEMARRQQGMVAMAHA